MYKQYLEQIVRLINDCRIYEGTTEYKGWEEGFSALFDLFYKTKKNKKQLFFIGNGGSAAIAGHMTADFMKNGGMRTVSLCDNALTTCMGNDYGYEYVFSKPLGFLANEDDLLVAISSSGNSQNIVNAILVAKEKKTNIVTLSGFKNDNRIKKLGDINLYVPSDHYGMVESLHNLFLQQVVDEIMKIDGITI